MRWWPWRRRRAEAAGWSPPDPVPDGGTVPVPGRSTPDELRRALTEPTQILPTTPMLTRAGHWRAHGGQPPGNGGRWPR